MSSQADGRLQELDRVLQCMPHELVRLVRDYDLRRRHRFCAEPCLDSIITVSQDRIELRLRSYLGCVAVRGECRFASAALHWSIKVPIGLQAWIGIVLLNPIRMKKTFDFEINDTAYLSISKEGTTMCTRNIYHEGQLLLSDGDTLWDRPRAWTPYTTFTFAVDLETQTLQIARNGIWTVNSFSTNLPNLAEATVYACLSDMGSLTLESTDE